MLLKHQPLVIVALTTLFLLFACNGHSSPVDEDETPDVSDADGDVDTTDYDHHEVDIPDEDIIPPYDKELCGDVAYNGGWYINATKFPEEFSGYTYVVGGVEITALFEKYKDLSDLSSLRCIGGGLMIHYNEYLESLKGLENLVQINGRDLTIVKNDKLTDISALQNITRMNGLIWIAANNELTSLLGMNNITENDEGLHIYENNVLVDVRLDNLQRTSGISLKDGNITSLEHLGELREIKSLDIGTKILSFYGLGHLEKLGDDITPENYGLFCLSCGELRNVDGLNPQLTQIDGNLKLNANKLENVLGFSNLTDIAATLQIYSSMAMISLAGLENIRTIGKDLIITDNEVLEDITALYSLESVGGNIDLSFNPRLPTCQGEKLVALLKAKGWNGTYDLSGTEKNASCEGDDDNIVDDTESPDTDIIWEPDTYTVDCGASPTGMGGDMCRIPAGEFMMGCNAAYDADCSEDEKPYHAVTLSEYFIDQYEVTVAEFRQCVEAGVCNDEIDQFLSTPDAPCMMLTANHEYYPMNCVDHLNAYQYCKWVGKRLPTEAEWEKAARGTDGRIYPWGMTPAPDCEHAVIYDVVSGGRGCGTGSPMAGGSKPLGVSPYGLYDMAGNIWECVGDYYLSDYYSLSPETDPTGPGPGPSMTRWVIRGGGWDYYDLTELRVSQRYSLSGYDLNIRYSGIRCALSQ